MLGHLDRLWDGLLVTMQLTVLSFAGGLVLGTVLAVMRIVPILPLRIAATAYVECVRNIPLLVMLVLFVFGLPEIGILYSLFWTVVTAMSLYAGAYIADIVRSGIMTVPAGEGQAARALGLTIGQDASVRDPAAGVPDPRVQPDDQSSSSQVALGQFARRGGLGVIELTGEVDLITWSTPTPGSPSSWRRPLYLLAHPDHRTAVKRLERRLAIQRTSNRCTDCSIHPGRGLVAA